MTKLAASKVRDSFADTINRVAYRGERIVLRRRGKDLVAIVPMEDLALIERMEDEIDVRRARGARSNEEARQRSPFPSPDSSVCWACRWPIVSWSARAPGATFAGCRGTRSAGWWRRRRRWPTIHGRQGAGSSRVSRTSTVYERRDERTSRARARAAPARLRQAALAPRSTGSACTRPLVRGRRRDGRGGLPTRLCAAAWFSGHRVALVRGLLLHVCGF